MKKTIRKTECAVNFQPGIPEAQPIIGGTNLKIQIQFQPANRRIARNGSGHG